MAVLRRTPLIVPVVAALVAIVVVGVVFFALRSGGSTAPQAAYHDAPHKAPPVAKPSAAADKAKVDAEARALGLGNGHPKAVEPTAGVVADTGAGGPTPEELAAQGAKHGAAAPSLKELQSELTQLKREVGISGHPRVTATGLAAIPLSAPGPVRSIVNAANKIALLPYRYGGGHGSFRDNAYDCSASVSYALAAAGLLGAPLTSGDFMHWGAAGRGKYVTIYANEGHAFMVVDGLRFDTGNLGGGTRWTAAPREVGGFTVRHPPGL